MPSPVRGDGRATARRAWAAGNHRDGERVMRLNNVSIATKIWGLAGAMTAALAAALVVGLLHSRDTMLVDRKEQIRNIVDVALSIAADHAARADRGEITSAEARETVKAILRSLRYGDGEYVFVFDDAATMLVHGPKPELEGRDVSGLEDPDGVRVITGLARAARGDGYLAYAWPMPGHEEPVAKISYAARFAPWDWNIGTGIYLDKLESAFWARARWTIVGGAIALVLVGAGAFFLIRSITGPLRRTTAAVAALADGDTEVAVDDRDRCDEIGRMAGAVDRLRHEVAAAFRLNQMVERQPAKVMLCDTNLDITYVNEAARGILSKLSEQMGCRAEEVVGRSVLSFHKNPEFVRKLLADPANLPYSGRFTMGGVTIENTVIPIHDGTGRYIGPMLNWTDVTRYVGMIGAFQEKVQGAVREVTDASEGLSDLARGMKADTGSVGERAAAVASAAGQAEANVQTVAAAAEELSASIAEIGRRVTHASDVSAGAAKRMAAAQGMIDGLDASARQIGDVVNLINDIASQTNLLALNATIEAARAGEAGKGFAVVANEVKSLAGQTARATDDIARQITAVQAATAEVIAAIGEIGGAIREVSEVSTAIAAAVEEQNAATDEISRNITQASEGTTAVTRDIAAVAASTDSAEASSGGVSAAADRLSGLSAELSGQVDAFLAFMEEKDDAA